MDWRTKLLDPKPLARQDYASLATPVYRGSTVVLMIRLLSLTIGSKPIRAIPMACMVRQPR